MDDILTGVKRRYHIESVVKETSVGKVYRAFSRRRVGQKIKRRYYAVVEKNGSVSCGAFENMVLSAMMTLREDTHLEERFENGGLEYAVLAKGKETRKKNSRWNALQNHGYLMLLLSALIFILLIIKFFQS